MATDHSLEARRGLVTALRANADLLSAVGQRIYGEKVPANPAYPFIRVGLVIPRGFEASGISGMQAVVNIDCVSDHVDASEAYTLSASVVDILDQATPPLGGDASILMLDWTGTTPRTENGRYRQMAAFSFTTQSPPD